MLILEARVQIVEQDDPVMRGWEEKRKKGVKKEKRRKKETDWSRSAWILGGGPDAWAAEGEVRGRW